MVDVVDKQTRSRMMQGIRGKNTKPELEVRRRLHALGVRYRLHDASLPGSPDIVIRKLRVAVFVHGCFWHGHTGCPYFKLPATNSAFWKQKIEGNRDRYVRQIAALSEAGWRVATIWECGVRADPEPVVEQLLSFFQGTEHLFEIASWRPDPASF